jgi:glucosyl-dolichyl phosphate glucuronosyltransferase
LSGKAPLISVVIATYNRYRVLPEAIASMIAQDIDPELLQIIVVDNSVDQSKAAEFSRRYAGVSNLLYLLEPTVGLSNARNIGIRHSKAEIVAFIDDDATAAPDWCRQIHEAFNNVSERVAAIGGAIRPRWISKRPEWLTKPLLEHLSLLDWGGVMRETWKADCIFGCNLAFRKAVLLEVGGFSIELGRHGDLLISNDEIDLQERIRAKGYRSFYCPTAVVEHTIDPSRLEPAWFRRRMAWQAVSDFIQDEPKAAAGGNDAAMRIRSAFERLVMNERNGVVDDEPLSVEQEADLSWDLVIAALSGVAVFSDSRSEQPASEAPRAKEASGAS